MLNPMFSIQENLDTIRNANKSVSLHLRGGQQLDGKVGNWSDSFVVLTELVGKEFYDAVVRIEDISAISVRAR